MSAPTCCGRTMTFDIHAPRTRCFCDCGHVVGWQPEDGYPDDGEKGWSLGYRKPTGREARIIEEWDAAAYERDNPIGGGR